jgi:hypothetical protein
MNLSLDPSLTALSCAISVNGNSLSTVVNGQPTLRPAIRGDAMRPNLQRAAPTFQSGERKHGHEESEENGGAHYVA